MVTKDSGIGISFLIVYVAAWLLNHAHQVSSDICGSGDPSTVTKGSGIGSSFLIVTLLLVIRPCTLGFQ